MPIAGYTVDFCCLSADLGVEVEGGQHYDEKGKQYYKFRAEALHAKGIRLLRFSGVDSLKCPDAVQETIYRELTEKPPP